MRVGFVGLGLMGTQITVNLLKAGYDVAVWNRTKEKAEPLLAAGASWAASIRELALHADVIMTMVTDAAAAEAVICGSDGILASAKPGSIVIDMSSIPPESSRSFAARATERGVRFLDAPVTGNPKVAAAAKLGIMIGGDADTVEAVRPLLEKLSTVIVHAGPSGTGSTLKLVNNLILGVAIQAVAEALVLARKAGIDPNCLREITSVGGARTGAMETRGQRMIDHDFAPHFSTNNMHKDLSTAVALANAVGAATPVASVALEVLRAAKAQHKGELDSAIIYTIVEQLSGIGQPAEANGGARVEARSSAAREPVPTN